MQQINSGELAWNKIKNTSLGQRRPPAALGPLRLVAASGCIYSLKPRATKERCRWEILMQITKHEKSYIAELSDRSVWRIWPADMADTLQWLLTTEINITNIDDEVCSHALINEIGWIACAGD